MSPNMRARSSVAMLEEAKGMFLALAWAAQVGSNPPGPSAIVTMASSLNRLPSLNAIWRNMPASHRRLFSTSCGRSNRRQVPKGRKLNPPRMRLWMSGFTSLAWGRNADPNSASQRIASSSVMAPDSSRRISALRRMAVVVTPGYALYQKRVGTHAAPGEPLEALAVRRPLFDQIFSSENRSSWTRSRSVLRAARVMKSSR